MQSSALLTTDAECPPGPSVWVCPPCTGDLPVFEERHVSYPQHRWRIGRERVTGAEVF